LEPPSLDFIQSLPALFKPISVEVITALFAAGILLVCSALISGSEVAFFSVGPSDKETLENEKSTNSKRILLLLARPQRLLATILIANNLVNIGIVVLSSFIIAMWMDFTGYPVWVPIAIQLGAVTFLLLLIGEVFPKVYATLNILRLCRIMSAPLVVLSNLFLPLSRLLITSGNFMNRMVKARTGDYSVDELEQALEMTIDDKTPLEDEKILKGIVRFGATDVKQIMQPRTEVVSFEKRTAFPDLLEQLLDAGFSRVPVYAESLDQIEGILYLKDLLPHAEKTELEWNGLLRPAYFVPENKKLDDLLKEFQEKKIHMAIVVDEYGGTSGVLTLEDIIEEIVGDITDEFDDDDVIYSKLDDSNYVFEGKIPLVDLYKILEIEGQNFEEAKGESDTLAGFVLELAGKIPLKNEKTKFENYIFTVEAADKRRIKRIKLTILDPVESF